MPTATTARRRKPDHKPEDSYVLIRGAEPIPPAPDPATLPMHYDGRGRAAGMRYQREKLYAWSMSSRFFEWLVLTAAAQRVPLDDCLSRLENLACCLEIHLMARVTWPALFPQVEADDEAEELFVDERAAKDAGLTVDYREKRKRNRTAPNLPGCHGTPGGGACQNLRRHGEKFCPSCRRRELQRLRNEALTR